jgi:hypothetical protein
MMATGSGRRDAAGVRSRGHLGALEAHDGPEGHDPARRPCRTASTAQASRGVHADIPARVPRQRRLEAAVAHALDLTSSTSISTSSVRAVAAGPLRHAAAAAAATVCGASVSSATGSIRRRNSYRRPCRRRRAPRFVEARVRLPVASKWSSSSTIKTASQSFLGSSRPKR